MGKSWCTNFTTIWFTRSICEAPLAWRGSGQGTVACFDPAAPDLGLDAATRPVPEPGATVTFEVTVRNTCW